MTNNTEKQEESKEMQRLRESWERLPERAQMISARDRFNKYFEKEAKSLVYGNKVDGLWYVEFQMHDAYRYRHERLEVVSDSFDLMISSLQGGKFVHALKYKMLPYVHDGPAMLHLGIEFAEANNLGKREIKKVVRHLKKESENMYASAYETYKSWISDIAGVGAPAHLEEYENHRKKIVRLEKLIYSFDKIQQRRAVEVDKPLHVEGGN